MRDTLEFILKLTDRLTPGMRAATGIANTSADRIESEFARIGRSGRRMGASVDELRNRLEAINKVRFSTTVTREFDIATRAAQRLERQIGKLENRGTGGGLGVGGLIKGNLVAAGIQQVGSSAMSQGQDVYNKGLDRDRMRSALNATTRGQGDAVMAQIEAMSNRLGVSYAASLDGVKTLTGGLMGLNMPLEKQLKIFEGVATGAAAMKLTEEQMSGAMLALGQMASKGTVQAEELRGQLGERIPGAFSIAARAMNVTEMQLNKMLQKGEVASSEFLPRFAAEMQKTFGDEAMRSANGPAAIQARFDNAMLSIKQTVGEGIMPLITPLMERFSQIATAFLPSIVSSIQWLVGGVSSLVNGTSDWSGYLSTVRSIAVKAWDTISRIGSAVWSIVGGVIDWIGKSQILKDVFSAIGWVAEKLLGVVGWIADKLKWIWDNVIRPILDAIEWVYGKIRGLFDGGKAEVVVTDGRQTAVTTSLLPGLNSGFQMNQPGSMATSPLAQMPGSAVGSAVKSAETPITKAAIEKTSQVNAGGQRSIVINIGKQIESLQMTVSNAQQGATEIADLVAAELRKVFYQLEATGA